MGSPELDTVGHGTAVPCANRADVPGDDTTSVIAAVGDIINGVYISLVGVVGDNDVILRAGPDVAVVDSVAYVIAGPNRTTINIGIYFFQGEHGEEQVGDLLADRVGVVLSGAYHAYPS